MLLIEVLWLLKIGGILGCDLSFWGGDTSVLISAHKTTWWHNPGDHNFNVKITFQNITLYIRLKWLQWNVFWQSGTDCTLGLWYDSLINIEKKMPLADKLNNQWMIFTEYVSEVECDTVTWYGCFSPWNLPWDSWWTLIWKKIASW